MQREFKYLFEPDVLSNSRFFEAHRSKNIAEREKALLFAVLSDAVAMFKKFAFSTSARGRALFDETRAWFWDEEPDYLFSFKNICEVMGLNPAFVRSGLQQWIAAGQHGRIEQKKPHSGRGRRRRPARRRLLMRCRTPRIKGGWA